jgi:sugar phosphate isomerase/epimerase
MPFLDLPKIARQDYDIGAIELVNQMMASSEPAYIDELAKNAADNKVAIPLIMCDGGGAIGGEKEEDRQHAVESHSKWIDIAARLGCHSIRMNWAGAAKGTEHQPDALKAFTERSIPGFKKLCEYGESKKINVIIENHGGPSSYPEALLALIKAVNHPRFGTLPDFGGFPADVDRYQAIDAMMPYAKAVSAKCYDFDDTTGLETKLDYPRIVEIVVDKHGYRGNLGIEYEGNRLSEKDGVKACKTLLEKLRG